MFLISKVESSTLNLIENMKPSVSSKATVTEQSGSFSKGASFGVSGEKNPDCACNGDYVAEAGTASAAIAQQNPAYSAKTRTEYGASAPTIPTSSQAGSGR